MNTTNNLDSTRKDRVNRLNELESHLDTVLELTDSLLQQVEEQAHSVVHINKPTDCYFVASDEYTGLSSIHKRHAFVTNTGINVSLVPLMENVHINYPQRFVRMGTLNI